VGTLGTNLPYGHIEGFTYNEVHDDRVALILTKGNLFWGIVVGHITILQLETLAGREFSKLSDYMRIAAITDYLHLAAFDGELILYEMEPVEKLQRSYVLERDGKTVAGATLRRESNKYWIVTTLWAQDSVGAIALLYTILRQVGGLVASQNISPAAVAVVSRFYKKYQGTAVVTENVIETAATPFLRAGYRWVDNLPTPPVKVIQINTLEEEKAWQKKNSDGFNSMYEDQEKTKVLDLNLILKKRDQDNLIFALRHHFRRKPLSVYQWIKSNKPKLEEAGFLPRVLKEIEWLERNV
jgi:hypothetical protein